MRNVPLHESIKAYCQAALRLIQTRFSNLESLPLGSKRRVKITGQTLSVSHYPAILWNMFVFQSEHDLQQMDAYRAAIEVMQQDERVARHLSALVGTVERRYRVNGDSLLRSVLIELLETQQDFSFHEALFDQIYMEFEQALYEDMIDYRYLTVLEGFRMEAEKVELGPQFSIIRISPAEREEILSSDSMLTIDPLDQARKAVASHEYALEHYHTVPKVIGDPPEAPHSASPSQIVEERFAEACSALRLFKAGIFGHGAIWHYAPRGWLLSRVESHFSLMSFLRYGAQYLLSADEIQPFSGFWQSYQCARQTRRKAIDVALRRLNFGYERIRPEDRLIDYSIGFEALLLGDNRQELSYRLALRGAALLGKTPEQREQIFDELNRAYGLRSDIVHGTTIKEPIHLSDRRISFDDFVASIEGYLRSAITELSAGGQTRYRLTRDRDVPRIVW